MKKSINRRAFFRLIKMLYAAKLKESAKPVVDQKPKKVTKKELARQEKEAKEALVAKEMELKSAEEAMVAKKQAQKEKRRLARQAKKQALQTPPPSEVTTESVSEVLEVKPKPVRKRKRVEKSMDEQVDEAVAKIPEPPSAGEEPPAWFKKYVAGVKNEERELQERPKKAKKEVAKEADQMAQKQWGNGLVRDRVRNEVDKHMSRMYQMIFNRSSFDGL